MSTNLITMVLAATLLTGIVPATAINVRPQANASPLQVSEPTPLQLYLEKLAWYESNGREDISIIDSNGKRSKGCLQFQDATWLEKSKKYGLEGDIMSCQLQKKVAEQMFLHEPNAYRHWYTSIVIKGLGKPILNGS